jgi:hypothetical protein
MMPSLHRIGAGVSFGLALFAWALGNGGATLLLGVIAVCFYLSRHE